MEGRAVVLVEDLMMEGHGVMNGLAYPKERAKPSHGLLVGNGRQTDHSKVSGTAGNGSPSLTDAVVVGSVQIGFVWNEVVTLGTHWSPGAHLLAKGTPSHCGREGSSERGSEQRMFGLDVVNELGILLGNCSAMGAEGAVECKLKGA